MQTRAVFRFLLLFLVWHVGLLLLWPVLAPAFRPVYRATASAVVEGLSSTPLVAVLEIEQPGSLIDTKIQMERPDPSLAGRDARQRYSALSSSYLHSYLSLTVLLALVLATPANWKRRRNALLVGLVTHHLLVAIRILVLMEYAARSVPLGGQSSMDQLSPAIKSLLESLKFFFGDDQNINYLVPILTWAAFFFGRRRVLSSAAPGSGTPSSPPRA